MRTHLTQRDASTDFRFLGGCPGAWAVLLLVAAAVSPAACAPVAGKVLALSPDTVVVLARTQSVGVRLSEYQLKSQEIALKSALTGFLPTVSMSVGMTHLGEQPMAGGGSMPYTAGGLLQSMSDTSGKPDSAKWYRDSGDVAVARILDGILAGLNAPRPLSPQNLYNVGFTVSQPIFAGFRILNAARMARLAHSAQVFTHERTLAEIGYTALQLYWSYVAILKSCDAAQEARIWYENLVRDQTTLFENGLTIELDLLNTKNALGNAQLTEIRSRNAARTFGEQFLLFLNQPTDAEISVDTSQWSQGKESDFVPAMPDSIRNWIAFREDLSAAERQLELVKISRAVQLGAYAPTIGAFVNVGYSNQYSTSEDDMRRSSAVGLQLNWMLFDWGKALREAQKSDIQTKMVELQLADTKNRVWLKYVELARKVEESRAALSIALQAVENSQKALAIAKAKSDAQMITNTELLTARMQLTSQQIALVQARVSAILALEEYRLAPLSASGPTGGAR